jgi:hypothetical protein
VSPPGADDYSGWFRELPTDQRPEWAQKQVEDARVREAWESYAVERMRQYQAMVEARPGQKAPCIAVGIFVDAEGRRYAMVSISGKGLFTEQMRNAKHPRERFADVIADDLHAEQRLARNAAQMRDQNEARIARGKAPIWPVGVRLESVAAGYPVCRRRCLPELVHEGAKVLTGITPETGERSGVTRPSRPTLPQVPNRLRGRKPKR